MNKSLTIKEKIGQKFIFGINSYNINDIIYLIHEYAIGGVILYKKNYQSYEEMLDVIKRIKLANKDNKIPLFIAIDQEGGVVNRLPIEIVNLKNMYDLSKTDKLLVRDGAKILGKILRESGINMNLAPVLDMDSNNAKTLYKRCFYGNIDSINESANYYIKSMEKENIISVCKHYPGHGVSKMDSHIFVPYIFDTKKVLNVHIKPFLNVIKNNVDVIMVGHIAIRKMTGFLPASISKKFIKNYIRDKYDGIIITDEIKMLRRNILLRCSYLKKAMLAGDDIILVKIKDLNDGIKIMNKANKVFLNDKLMDESVGRILKIKKKYNINDDINFPGVDIIKINDEIKEINEKVNI